MTRRADQRSFHYIYKITRDDGKYYIGMHSTDDLEDGYFGSGKLITRSIKKHGKSRHSKEILEMLPTREMLKEREKEVVYEDLLLDKMCMNLRRGGEGNAPRGHPAMEPFWENITAKLTTVWADLNKRKAVGEKVAEWWTSDRRITQSELKKLQHTNPQVIANISVGTIKALAKSEVKQRMAAAKAANWQDPEYRVNQIAAQNIGKQTLEFSQKQRDAKLGEKNPNFGSQWIHSPTVMKSIRVSKTEPIPVGWLKGRKMYKVLQ